jgi:tRNA-2-methylthio-N6-dimethylallyladenosine synthase
VTAGKRVYIETYGCQMNVADSELMFSVLDREGYSRTEQPGDADVILVNTCAIRDHAEQRVLGRVGQLQQYRETRPDLLIGVTGCMAERLGATRAAATPAGARRRTASRTDERPIPRGRPG